MPSYSLITVFLEQLNTILTGKPSTDGPSGYAFGNILTHTLAGDSQPYTGCLYIMASVIQCIWNGILLAIFMSINWLNCVELMYHMEQNLCMIFAKFLSCALMVVLLTKFYYHCIVPFCGLDSCGEILASRFPPVGRIWTLFISLGLEAPFHYA